jgi:hypothetical protein
MYNYIVIKMEKKEEQTTFKIVKKVAKHGSQAIIVIPRALEADLCPGTIAEIRIEIIRRAD